MRTLNFYIMKQIIAGLIIITLAMLAIVWLTQSLRFLDMIITKGISAGIFIKLTILMLPNFLIILLPISLFAVTLFVYNRLSADKELIVMRSTGLHPVRLAAPALFIGAVAMAFSYLMSLKLVPESFQNFKELQWTIRNDVSHLILQEGQFNDIAKGLTVYVRKKDKDGVMYGLLIHDERKPNKVTIVAENGMMVDKKGAARVIIGKGSRQEVNKETGRFSVLSFDSYTMDFNDKEGEEHDRNKDLREMSLSGLKQVMDEKPKALVEINRRFVLPIYNLTFAFLAVAFLIRGNFNRRGQLPKVIASAFIMLLVESAELALENTSVKHHWLIPLMYVNALLPITLCMYILFAKQPFIKGRILGKKAVDKIKSKFADKE